MGGLSDDENWKAVSGKIRFKKDENFFRRIVTIDKTWVHSTIQKQNSNRFLQVLTNHMYKELLGKFLVQFIWIAKV